MTPQVLTYRVDCLPDPAYPYYQRIAGGDVRRAIRRDTEHVLRAVANLPSESASVAIRFVYEPNGTASSPQARLAISLIAAPRKRVVAKSLGVLLERGPLARFYELEPIESASATWEHVQAICDVVRRESAVTPLHGPDVNASIPSVYYTIRSFEPQSQNDYLTLDSVLDQINERVTVELCVEPADVTEAAWEHTRYLARLQSINRLHDPDESDELLSPGLLEADEPYGTGTRSLLRPLRYRDPLADEVLRGQQQFHGTLLDPHLKFYIRIFAETEAVARLVGSTIGESAFEDGSYRLLVNRRGEPRFDEVLGQPGDPRVVPAHTHATILPEESRGLYHGLACLAHVASVDELAGAFRLPVASQGSPCCIRKNTDPPVVDDPTLLTFGHDEQTAATCLTKDHDRIPRGLRLGQLTRHAFLSGVPGNGKTTAVQNLLVQLHGHGIPFLLIEPTKTEYRVFKTLKDHPDKRVRRLAREMAVYTPGVEEVSPFRLNPLQVLNGISRDAHIEQVLNCFKAAMPMSGPLLPLLAEALEEVYERHPDEANPPVLPDLLACAERVLASKGYSAETCSDVRAALEVRLGLITRRSTGRMFQCPLSVPSVEQLVQGYTLLELDALSRDEACLSTLFILTSIREHIRTTASPVDGVRLVIVLEEAHNIVGRCRDAAPSEENADPRAFAAEFICRMLVEFRALGVGLVIVDQHPSAVAPEVIKSTATKLAFRQVDKEDRDDLAATMLLGAIDYEEIARLVTGEAYFYTEGYYGPRRIRTPDLHRELDLPAVPIGQTIVPFLRDDPWFAEAARARRSAQLAQLDRRMDDFDTVRLEIARNAAHLVVQHPRILALPRGQEQANRLGRLAQRARALRERLRSALRTFVRDHYRPLLGPPDEVDLCDVNQDAMHKTLGERFEGVIEPDTTGCLDVLDRLIADCTSRRPSAKGA